MNKKEAFVEKFIIFSPLHLFPFYLAFSENFSMIFRSQESENIIKSIHKIHLKGIDVSRTCYNSMMAA